MKKITFLFLLTLLPLMASAYDTQINGIYYNLNADTKQATVTSGDTKYTGNIVIPATISYNDIVYSVISIGNSSFQDCTALLSVTIPYGVIYLENYAFLRCSSLKSVVIPNSVTFMGETVFQNCTSLTSVSIPESLNKIENKAFWGCTSLTSLSIPKSITTIGNSAFWGCTGLVSVTIPNSVTTIYPNAFQNCTALKSVIIPSSLHSISNSVFSHCSSLTQVTLPNSINSIASDAFRECTMLTSFVIPKSVTSIGWDAFSGNSNLKEIYCYAENVPDGKYAFQSFNFTNCTLHVPEASLTNYKSNVPWSKFGNIVPLKDDDPGVEKCATPTIEFSNGRLTFNCETEGVEFHYEYGNKGEGDDVDVLQAVKVSVYATKKGYNDSDVATEEIYIGGTGGIVGIKGDINEDGIVNGTDIQEVINVIISEE